MVNTISLFFFFFTLIYSKKPITPDKQKLPVPEFLVHEVQNISGPENEIVTVFTLPYMNT